jgi:hypothetical protein
MLNTIIKRSFASEKQLKLKIKSVSNISKITKAMKLISAIKMKKEIERLDLGSEFGMGTTMLNDGT